MGVCPGTSHEPAIAWSEAGADLRAMAMAWAPSYHGTGTVMPWYGAIITLFRMPPRDRATPVHAKRALPCPVETRLSKHSRSTEPSPPFESSSEVAATSSSAPTPPPAISPVPSSEFSGTDSIGHGPCVLLTHMLALFVPFHTAAEVLEACWFRRFRRHLAARYGAGNPTVFCETPDPDRCRITLRMAMLVARELGTHSGSCASMEKLLSPRPFADATTWARALGFGAQLEAARRSDWFAELRRWMNVHMQCEPEKVEPDGRILFTRMAWAAVVSHVMSTSTHPVGALLVDETERTASISRAPLGQVYVSHAFARQHLASERPWLNLYYIHELADLCHLYPYSLCILDEERQWFALPHLAARLCRVTRDTPLHKLLAPLPSWIPTRDPVSKDLRLVVETVSWDDVSVRTLLAEGLRLDARRIAAALEGSLWDVIAYDPEGNLYMHPRLIARARVCCEEEVVLSSSPAPSRSPPLLVVTPPMDAEFGQSLLSVS